MNSTISYETELGVVFKNEVSALLWRMGSSSLYRQIRNLQLTEGIVLYE